MATPPSSPPPPTGAASQLPSTLKRTRKATRLRSLATRPVGAERPLVHVDPVTGKGDGPHIKKLRTYLGIVAHDKVDVTYENWKQVPANQKDLIWEDIQLNLISLKWALSADKESVDDTVCEKYDISKEKWTQFCQTRRHMAETRLDDTPQSKSKTGARWIFVECNRQKGSTECGYYIMHWMLTIVLGSLKNNWEMYFNDARQLEPKRFKALRI
ncbi:hypothetical protein GmHk_04G010314 [Glycine max]|nr:hypothetical protein GmHk_04G010314 [Glycine max]